MDRHSAARRLRHLAADAGVTTTRMHPHMLRHTYVTTMLDAGVDLRDVQIAARHADPRTTMRYDRARKKVAFTLIRAPSPARQAARRRASSIPNGRTGVRPDRRDRYSC